MPWTEITRAQYRREGLRFASDMTDAEWALIARRLPPRRRLGRRRKTDLRRVVEAILYILTTGCQWRALPSDFPPRSTVQGYFYRWRTLAWLNRNRRLATDFEAASQTATAWLYIASVKLLSRRLARA